MKIYYRVASQSLPSLPCSLQNRLYLKFVRSMVCCACGRQWNIEAAHTGARGLGTKASDLDTIPLCRLHHQYGPKSYHVLGRIRFEQVHGLTIRTIIASLQIRAVACGIDLSADEVHKKRVGRAGGVRRRGVA